MVEGYFTEQEMADLMKLKVTTLKCRRSRGTEHPPYLELRRGVVLYPKDLFLKWVADRKVIWDVKRAG